MKTNHYIILAILSLLPLLSTSCGHSSGEIVKIIEERDSLKNVAAKQQRHLEDIGDLMELVNSGLDSIAIQENMIFPSISEGTITKDDVLSKIDGITKLIEKQKIEIDQLEKRITTESHNEPTDPNITKIIERFKSQLEEKDRQIDALKEELSKKDANITGLQQRLGSYARTIEELDKKNSMQNEALKRQDAMLNQCFMIVADKKTLQNAGIVKKGKLVAQGALDRTKFTKVNIRTFTEMEFDAKKPRLLTSMPESSFTLTTNGKNHYILQITNPSEFWRISNYLVIQTD